MIKNIVDKRFIVFVLFTFIFSSSCSSYRLINQNSFDLIKNIKPGDKVRITVIGDRVLKLKIMEINEEYLVGDNLETLWPDPQTIKFSEILKLEKGELNTDKTAALTVGMVVGIPVLLALSFIGLAFSYHGGR